MENLDKIHISLIRTKLLEELSLFINDAIKIPGITKISLIGSLCTNKPDPKDVDVLINIKDSVDLSRLAMITRRLNGHVQSFNHNADVFLSDTQMKYLGRICLWKNCGPGNRTTCDALNCGARKYLHDDLNTVTLKNEILTKPPIELWPDIKARVVIPVDVKKIIIDPLQE